MATSEGLPAAKRRHHRRGGAAWGGRSRGPNRALQPLRRSSRCRATMETEREAWEALYACRRRALRRRCYWLEAELATERHLGRGWVCSEQWSTGNAMDKVTGLIA